MRRMPQVFTAALAVLAFLFLAAPSCVDAAETQLVRSISVSGVGEVSAVPDKADIFVGVTTQGATAKAALDANNKAMADLFATIKAAGIADKDIQTQNFSIWPRYSQNANGETQSKIIGYDASNTVHVVIRDLATIGTVLDKFVESGANTFNGIQFGFADTDKLMNEARVEAVKDAKAKAQLYAETAGVQLGQVLTIQEGGAMPPPMPMMARMESFKADAVPVAPGEGTISAQVSITFALQ